MDYIVSRARRTLGIVRWIGRHFSTPDTMSLLFKALVRSHLESCTVVWNRTRACATSLIESVQRRFVRHMAWRLPLRVPDGYAEACEALGLSSLEGRREVFDLRFFIGALHGGLAIPGLIVNLRVPLD